MFHKIVMAIFDRLGKIRFISDLMFLKTARPNCLLPLLLAAISRS
jgi:hypothetical protein